MDVWISIVISVVSGIITGIFTGIITFWLIRCKKPKLEIANSIAKYKINNKYVYCIKVVNKSKCYLYNLHYELCLVNEIHWKDHKGDYDKIYDCKVLTFSKPMWNIMCPYSKKNTDFALRISTNEDLESLLSNNAGTFLTFCFTAFHGDSDSCKVYEKRYGITQIQAGRYVCGSSFKIE